MVARALRGRISMGAFDVESVLIRGFRRGAAFAPKTTLAFLYRILIYRIQT
jgi:hypothetical protein